MTLVYKWAATLGSLFTLSSTAFGTEVPAAGTPAIEVGIASESKLKIPAVTNAFEKLFPGRTLNFTTFKAPSGVAEQPVKEMWGIKGAENRLDKAKEMAATLPAAEQKNFDYWVSIENYIEPSTSKPGFWIDRAAVVIETGTPVKRIVHLSEVVYLAESFAEEARVKGLATGGPVEESGYAVTAGQLIRDHYLEKGIDLPTYDWHQHSDFGGISRKQLLEDAVTQAAQKAAPAEIAPCVPSLSK